MPSNPFRANVLPYLLITSCRWCDVPQGEQWASKSSAHRWLKRWQQDGLLSVLEQRILNLAQEKGLIRWEYGAVDGSFSPWQGWR
jgi:hypothetical protein